MSEKAHTPQPHYDLINESSAWRRLIWLIPFLMILFVLVFTLARIGPRVLDRLAAADPNPERRARMDSLRVTRALLLPPAEGARQLWQARATAAESGFFLAGAAFTEKTGREPAALRAWLALDAQGKNLPTTWESLPEAQILKKSLQQ